MIIDHGRKKKKKKKKTTTTRRRAYQFRVLNAHTRNESRSRVMKGVKIKWRSED